MDKLKQYQNLADTGIEWIGEVPSHWEALLLKRVTKVYNGSTPSTSIDEYWNGEIIWYTPDDLGSNKSKTILSSHRKITVGGLKNCGATLVPSNSIIISTRAPIGHIAITEIEATTNQGCKSIVVNDEKVSSEFIYYYLLSKKAILESLGSGSTFTELSTSELKSFPFILPPLPEQKAIATFLDHQTTRIDQLIEKKKRILELLDEQRQAIITRAVTKGIDQDAKMMDSGIEWLGDVPENWELNRLKFYTQINPVKSEVSFLPDDYEVTFTPMEAVKEYGGLDTSIEKTKGEVYQGYTYFKEGDVLSAKITPCFENGKAAIAENLKNGIGFGTTELHVLRPNEKLNRMFLFYIVISETFLKVGESEMLGAGGQKRVRQEFIEDWMWGFPPINEQEKIVQFIDEQSSKIDQLKSKIVAAIDHLEEYRSSLITQAVTGKIDVRDEVKERELHYAAEDGVSYQTN